MSSSRINDFVIKIATVNGTGSASANTLLMKSIFRSGIPVMGKNYFPSNIQGLPTWYEIRVSRHGHVARSGRVDIMVAMNPETYARDLKEVSAGATSSMTPAGRARRCCGARTSRCSGCPWRACATKTSTACVPAS